VVTAYAAGENALVETLDESAQVTRRLGRQGADGSFEGVSFGLGGATAFGNAAIAG
jgi:hypothetical protein